MSNGYRETEDLETTRVEKLLAFGLVVFLLIGMFWILDRTEELIPLPVISSSAARSIGSIASTEPPIEDELGIPGLRAQVESRQRIVARLDEEQRRKESAFDDAARNYKFRREETRTALEAGRPGTLLESEYGQARASYVARMAEWKRARAAADRARAPLSALQNRLSSLTNRAWTIFNRRNRARDLWLFLVRFGYSGALILLGWLGWRRGREARWRYLSLLTAFLIASVLQLLFLLFRYCWEMLADVAQLGVSVLGAVACGLALVALKRYLLSPERVARMRLAARACPHCATPFETGQAHCWDCGRSLLDSCPSCGSPHLRYAPHCPSCGREMPMEPVGP